MDDSLELPDDGLRDRIRKGFEDNANRKTKTIDNRPKTPRHITEKTKETNTTPDSVTMDAEKQKSSSQKKTKAAVKKTVVFKPKSDTADKKKRPEKKTSVKALPVAEKKTPEKKTPEKNTNVDTVYLCHKCDKSYKSKSGIVKHMEKCK
jgi:hypothetical protein